MCFMMIESNEGHRANQKEVFAFVPGAWMVFRLYGDWRLIAMLIRCTTIVDVTFPVRLLVPRLLIGYIASFRSMKTIPFLV